MTNFRTYPPNTFIVAHNVTLTTENIGVQYTEWPYSWAGNNAFDATPNDYSASYPLGDANKSNLDQYNKAKWIRYSRPNSSNMWNPATSSLGANSLAGLLATLDFWHARGKKVLWVMNLYITGADTWAGYSRTTSAQEIQAKNYLIALLTSTTTSLTYGFTVANHPALAAIEPANEVSTSGVAADYARMQRVAYQLFKLYKPDCIVGGCGSVGNVPTQTYNFAKGNAVSLIPASADGSGDDGTGKFAYDYTDVNTTHLYNNIETVALFTPANNSIANTLIRGGYAAMKTAFDGLEYWDTTSPYYGLRKKQWNSESSILMTAATAVTSGGFRWFRQTYEERKLSLLKNYLPTFFMTYDTSTSNGYGVSFISGVDIADRNTNSGTISNIISGGGGKVNITLSTAPDIGWYENSTVQITAGVSGWADLGLSAGETKRFNLINISGATADVFGTTYTAVPSGTQSFSAMLMRYGPYPEEWSWFVDLITSAPVTFGWIPYSDGYMGIMLHVQGIVTYYTKSDGTLSTW